MINCKLDYASRRGGNCTKNTGCLCYNHFVQVIHLSVTWFYVVKSPRSSTPGSHCALFGCTELLLNTASLVHKVISHSSETCKLEISCCAITYPITRLHTSCALVRRNLSCWDCCGKTCYLNTAMQATWAPSWRKPKPPCGSTCFTNKTSHCDQDRLAG